MPEQPTPNRLTKLGVALVILAAMFALVGLWWWALLGMTTDVGAAWMFTAWGIGGAGAIAWVAGADDA